MGFSLGDLYICGLMVLNGLAVLHEQRFLAKCDPSSLLHPTVKPLLIADVQTAWRSTITIPCTITNPPELKLSK